MKKLVLAGAAAIVLAGGAVLAQTPGQPAPPPPGAEGSPPHPPMDGAHEHMHEHMHGGPPWMRMMRMRAAHFHFSRGENVVDISCAAEEPMKACVEAASALLDKLATQR